ncbi:MAG: calcium-binding protein [Fibrobacter sp.]|nr:calcium-binding protein [Fibrobacter sp.]
MSKLNKKNGKNNNQNNYRIEQLEPRFMMDAAPTDTDWKNEIDDIDIGSYNLPATTGESIEGLIAYNEEYIANRVSLPDVLDSREVDFSDEVDDVKDFIKDTVETLQEEAEENAENAKDAAEAALTVAEQNYSTAKAAYESQFPNPDDISPAFSETEQGISLQTLINGAQNAYNAALAHYNQVTTNFQIDASTLCARLVQDNENNNWTFIENSGKINVSISINQAVSLGDSFEIVPDIAEKTKIDVAFGKLQEDEVEGFAEVSFEIDGMSQTSINSNASVEIGFGFYQDLSKTDAKIGVLGLTSIADSNESIPDLKIMAKYTFQGNTSSYDTEFEYDLDFMVKNSSLLTIQNGFYVDDSNHLKYTGKSTAGPKWSSGSNAHDEDVFVPDFANVQMGEILNQFNAIAKWLQKIESDILKNNFQGMIEQNASSFLRLSTIFEKVIKTPPRSLQELLNESCFNNVIGISFTKEGNANFCNLIFTGLQTSQTANASLSEDFLNTISDSLSEISKNTLSLNVGSSMNLTLRIPMSPNDAYGPNDNIRELLRKDSNEYESNDVKNGCSNVVQSDTLSTSFVISEPIKMKLVYDNDGNETEAGCTVANNTSDKNSLVTAFNTALNTVIDDNFDVLYDENLQKLAVFSDEPITSMSFLSGNSREIGFSGAQQFCMAYIIDGDSIKIYENEIEVDVNNGGNLTAAINDFLMKSSDYVDYSAISFGSKTVVVYNPSSAGSDVNPWENFSGGVEKHVLISSVLPVVVPKGEGNITISLNGVNSTPISCSFNANDFEGCYSTEDVARVISKKIPDNSGVIVESGNGNILFYCNESSFSVSTTLNILSFSSSQSSTDCMEIVLEDDTKIHINLKTVLENPNAKFSDVVQAICSQCDAVSGVTAQADGLTISLSGKKIKSISNLNGFSIATLLGIAGDWNETPISKIEIKAPKQKEIEITKFDITVNENLTGNGTLASATLGLVGIDVSGSIGVSSTKTINLKIGESIKDISEIEFETNFNDFFNDEDWSHVSNANNLLSIKHQKGLSGDVAAEIAQLGLFDEAVLSPIFEENAKLQYEKQLFANISMSSLLDKVVDAVRTNLLENIFGYGVDASQLSQNSVEGMLNQKLPLFGKSAPELLGLVAKLNDVISNISQNQPTTLQELVARVKKTLGAALSFTFNENSIDFDLEWNREFKSEQIPINNFSLMDSVNVGGYAEVYLNGSIHSKFCFSVATTGLTLSNAQLMNGSFVSFDAKIIGKPLAFELSLALLGDVNKSVPLLNVVSGDSAQSYVNLKTEALFTLQSSGSGTSLEWNKTSEDCRIGGELKLQCAGLDAGSIKIGVQGANGISSWQDSENDAAGQFTLSDLVSGNFGVKLPEFLNLDPLGNVGTGNIVLDLSNVSVNFDDIDLFGQLRLVSDALSSVLRKAQSCLNTTFLSDGMRKIPLVGDSIVGAADCLTELDEKFIEPFRKFSYNTQNLNAAAVAERLYSILNSYGILKNFEKVVSENQNVAWAGTCFDKYYANEGKQYVQYNESDSCAEWRICLGKTFDLDANADFDLGMPGLGLAAEGGVNLTLEWKWYIGFGISKEKGAYILLSKGSDVAGVDDGKNIVADGISRGANLTGDDIVVTVKVSPNVEIDGSLGFLQMNAHLVDDSDNNLSGNPALSFDLGIDLNDGLNGSKRLDEDQTSDLMANTEISVNSIASNLSVEANLDGGVGLNVKMTLGFGADKVDVGFPEIGATFSFLWKTEYGKPSGALSSAGFKDVYFDMGSFVERTLQPVLNKIKKVLDPIMPLIEFLQSDIPVLSSLPGSPEHLTVLSLIKSIGSAKGLNLGMLDDIVQLANMVKTVGNLNLGKINLGSLNFPVANGLVNQSISNALLGIGKIDLESFSFSETNNQNANIDSLNSFSSVDSDGYGFSLPFLMDGDGEISVRQLGISTIQFLFGQDVDLIKYNMRPLILDFDWSKSFAIVGPLFADIGFSFGVDIDLCFGYDTCGLRAWKDSGFRDLWALTDGFYIDDLRNGEDVSEVIFYSGITAGASVGGRAGIDVGVNLNINLNFDDPNNDGKIRLTELADNLANSPMAMFDTSMTLQARAFAYLDLFFYRKEWDLWKSGALELFNTEKVSKETPVLATVQDGDVVVNIGEYAAKRLNGNVADNDDEVEITCSSGKVSICFVDPDNNENSYSKDYSIGVGKTLYVYAGKGNDKITVTGSADYNVVIEGGEDNDEIDLKGLSLTSGAYAVALGGAGNDYILGVDDGVNFLFGENARIVLSEDKKKVLLAENYPELSSAGNNVIVGGKGYNYIFGGLGDDYIVGGANASENYIFGDFGHLEFDALGNLNKIARSDLFDEGGDDTIFGSNVKDHIYGGAGTDSIDGRQGDDEIHAGKGNDVVYGGSGSDVIYGDDGVDVIFGDSVNSGTVIAEENNMTTAAVPYAYVSEELKKSQDLLTTVDDGNNSSHKKLATYDFVTHYGSDNQSVSTFVTRANEVYSAQLSSGEDTEPEVESFDDVINGGNGSDIILGNSGNDVIEGDAGNDLIKGGEGDDIITGGFGEDLLVGGQGNDTLDGGAGNDIVFGDDGWTGYASKNPLGNGLLVNNGGESQTLTFGNTINAFIGNFEIYAEALSNTSGGADTIIAGNGSDIVDGQSGDDSYIVNMMGGGNRAYTNVMDSGKNDASDSLTINGTVNADEFLIRASDLGLGMVASLPEIQTDPNTPASRTQIERVNFWNVGGEKTGVENLAVNAGAGDDKISIDGTLSTIAIDAGAGNDTVTVGQMFDSKRTTDANLSNVQPKDVFGTTETTQGYLSNGVEHATSIVGGEGDDTFNVLHNKAAVSLSGGLGNDTFNVAMFQEKHEDETTSIVENGPVTLIGGAGIDKMSIAGSEGDDTFVISHGRIFGEGIDVQTVSIEDKNVYGGDGDDSFYVLDSEAKEITKLYGNKGNDSFYNGGVGSADMPAFLTATAVDSGAINVVFMKADDTTKVLDTPTAILPENGNAVDAYRVKLDRAPKAGETVTVTVFAPGATTEAHGRGDREIWLVDGSGKLCKSMTFKFAATATGDGVVAWNSPQLVKVLAIGDAVREGDDYFSLLHNVSLTATQTNVEASVVNTCKNALVFLDEPGTQTTVDNKFSVTREVVVTASTGNEVAVDNLLLPSGTSGINAWYMQNGAPVSIDAGRLSIDEDVLKININSLGLTPGTRIYFNYQHESVRLDDESIVQMAYSTEGMTDMLEFTSADDGTKNSVCAESLLGTIDADNARYVYRTAGTQIIILDKVSLKPVSLKGDVSFQQVDDTFVYPQVTIYDEENSFQNVSKEEIAQHMQDNTIENIKGTLYEDGMGKEFSLGDVGPEMLRYGTSTTPTTNDEKNAASAEDLAAWAAAAQAAAQFDESQSVDRVFTNNMGNAKAGVKNDLQALESVGTIDQSLIPVAGGSPVILNSLPDVQKQADTEWFNSDSESLRFTHKDLAATDENRINTGNMEYGEYNLGSGADTVDIYKSIYREDGFQTFTVMNSGEGGDTINVHSYQDGEDDQLVINAGEGNDTVDATGANVTKEGLIVFGGLGDDTIDIGSDSSLVFGDRGQVLYHDDDGHVMTRLGDDRTGTPGVDEEDEEWNAGGSDYATGKNKDSEAYWQTDGVRRGPSIARTVTENQGGNDVITLADGRNVVFGGVNATRTVPANISEHENENEVISTGNGDDLVFGDDGYATFGGHASIAEALGQDNAPEVRTEATLSFNFMGASQTGLSSEDVAGAADFAKSNWNNVGGSLAGTYGNDDREIVRFDDNTRASAVSVSYGGIESHRNTSTDNRINLQAYGHNFANASTDADAALMNSGYMTTAPGNQCDNRLEVAVDGLAQYFTDYHVAVYLDMPDANSWEGQSIRKVSLYIGGSATAYASYYVNDCAGSNFNGTYKRSEYTSAEAILADLAHNAAVLSGELMGDDAVLIDTTGNYVVFEVPAGVAADNFRVIIEDGYTLDNINGKDIPGIAAIQVKGTLHAQDVAASTDIAHGGADTVYTSGGDDIVVGGTGGDTLTTYGDERYGIYDNDVVFGDNAKMVFTDRDSSEATASTLSLAESLDSRTVAGDYNDHIYTGDGNDVVVGGQGADHIESGATAAAEAMLDGIQVASFNFTRENATASEIVAPGDYIPVLDENNQPVYENDKQVFDFIPHETAGVVADNDWTNLYIKNNGLHVVGENYTNDPVTHDGIGISLVAYDTAVGDGTQNSSLMPKDDAQLDGDTSNSKLFNAYYAAQQQQEIKLTLTNLDSFAGGAPCDVYVYLGGDQQNTDTYNYLFDVWGHQVGGATPDRHYYLNDWTGSHFDGDYRRVERETAPTAAELLSQVAPDMSLVGNYVVFRGVSTSTFEVRIRNLFTDTNQWPLNLPVITAVQVVAGENREEDIAVGGDHDKDLVFGDDARVTFDIDTPFARNENLADYANRAIEAESIHYDGAAVEIPLDENDEPVETGDTILTGKDRDVIVGGDFGDTITMGDGDDVALGDNASLILEHNNPVGVFAPSVEIMLEQHTVTTSTPEVFLGNNDADADDIQDKFENGGVPGVTPETSENGATDTFTDTTDKDWTVQQEVTPGTISQTIDISSGAQVVNFAEGETVLLVSDTWPGNQWWHPNIVMVADGQGHSVPALEWEWDVNGTTMTATTQPGYYFTVDIPDTPNGDNRYEIRVTALAAGTAVISIGA